jgi:hypothetical protein
MKEWLLRHTQCCMCQQTYLPVDAQRGTAKQTLAIQELSQQYATAAATSYFCIRNGLIRIPASIQCTRSQLKQLEQHIFSGTVLPAELISLRSSHIHQPEFTTTTTEEEEQNRRRDHPAILGSNSTDDLTAPMDLTASFDSDFEGIETTVLNYHCQDLTTTRTVTMLLSSTSHLELGVSRNPHSVNDDSRNAVAIQELDQREEQLVHWDQELVSVADYLERNQLLPDNRCCIKENNEMDGGIEVEVTTSRRCIDDGEENDGSQEFGSSSHDSI